MLPAIYRYVYHGAIIMNLVTHRAGALKYSLLKHKVRLKKPYSMTKFIGKLFINLITLELEAKAKLSSNSMCDQINKKQCF